MASEDVDFPMGINLGLDHITSAYLTATDEVVTVASVETNDEWKELYHHNLRVNRSEEEKKTYAMSTRIYGVFYSILFSIRDASVEKLGRPHEINAISFPEHFGGIYAGVLINAATNAYPAFKDCLQARTYLNNIRLAYGLDTSEALNYDSACDLQLQNAMLVYVDLQKSFLACCLASIDAKYHVPSGNFFLDGFGGAENNASPQEVSNFKTRFQSSIEEELHGNPGYPTLLSDFRFVIFTGEGSSSEFKKIREAILDAYPYFSDKILDSIDPFWAGAIAAAHRGKGYAIEPPDHTFYMSQCAWSDDPKDNHRSGEYEAYFKRKTGGRKYI